MSTQKQMILYATTTSERASKGQGGNEYLQINITNEKKHLIACINLDILNNNLQLRFALPQRQWAISETKRENFSDFQLNAIASLSNVGIEKVKTIKGNKKKDESYSHDHYTCEECGKYKSVLLENGKCAECNQ